MTKWKKGQKEFNVSLRYDDKKGNIACIPKPVIEQLGEPDNIKFEIKKNGKITVVAGDST